MVFLKQMIDKIGFKNQTKFSNADHSFVTFFMQLTRYLQQAIGTIPAIHLNAYLNNIGEEDELIQSKKELWRISLILSCEKETYNFLAKNKLSHL